MDPINKLVENRQYNNAKIDISPLNIALSIRAV
jgi:hypothetical protein